MQNNHYDDKNNNDDDDDNDDGDYIIPYLELSYKGGQSL